MLRARPCRKIIAAFGHKLEREIGPNAVYPGQIFSKQAMKCFANIEGQPVRLSTFLRNNPLSGQRVGRLQSEAEGLGAATKVLENPLSIASLIV